MIAIPRSLNVSNCSDSHETDVTFRWDFEKTSSENFSTSRVVQEAGMQMPADSVRFRLKASFPLKKLL